MGEKKKTFMVLKVDLQCPRCYKKVKKVLYKFPQIQDQAYNEGENLVMITVVYCCPESIKQKIISKGGGAIKSIEIKEPEKPKATEPVKPKSAEPEKNERRKKKEEEKKDDKKEEPKAYPLLPPFPPWLPASDEPFFFPIVGYVRIPDRSPTTDGLPKSDNTTWSLPTPVHRTRTFGGCSEGPCYEGYGRPVYDSYGGGYGSGSYVSRGDYYSEENPTGCTVM